MSRLTRRAILKSAALATVSAPVLIDVALASEREGKPAAPQQQDLLLWYRQPSTQWVEALPIGNGRLGAMIHGRVDDERIELNDNTLYSGEPGDRDLPTLNVSATLEQVVQWLREEKYAEANEWVCKNWLGRQQACYQPLGDLRLKFSGAGEPSEYRRELDLS